MRVCVSACLLGERCKYSGGSNAVPGLARALATADCEAVPVCPEVMGGLSVPRPPAEICAGRVVTAAGDDLTPAFRAGAARALAALDLDGEGCAAALLQPRSPSCGVDEVYDGAFSGRLVPGEGLFAAALRGAGVPAVPADAPAPELAARLVAAARG